MPFCANCGAKVGDNDKFCASCGTTRVPGAQEPSSAVPPPPPPPQYQPPPQAQYQPPPAYGQPTGGYQQPGMQPVGQPNTGDSSTGLKANIAGLLCYLGWWVTGIVFLVLEKNSKFVRFHAAQSIVVFGILSVLGIILNVLPWNWVFSLLSALVGLFGFILWLVLMYKAYQGEVYKLPVIGGIAESIVGNK